MSGLILCRGRMAKTPYCLKRTNTRVYSVEEMCYYISRNMYSILEETFDERFCSWMEQECGQKREADKLRELMERKESKEYIIAAILESSDYFDRKERQDIMVQLQKFKDMPFIRKKVYKGDYYLQCERYGSAINEYSALLEEQEGSELEEEEYARILHNMAVASTHTASYKEAAELFLAAYGRNHKVESLRQYIAASVLGKEEGYVQRLMEYAVDEKVIQEIADEVAGIIEGAEHNRACMRLERIKELKEQGYSSEYYKELSRLISDWKERYKKEAE